MEELNDFSLVFGLNMNTNGGIPGGINIRAGIKHANTRYHYVSLEAVNIRHPKELRAQSDSTGNIYIYGKTNYLFSLRLSYGLEYVLFRRDEAEGLQIHGILAGGPSFGFLKPYYVRYGPSVNEAEAIPFDPAITSDIRKIYGSGGIFTGMNEAENMAGLHAKASLLFEFGTFGSSVTGMEIGVMYENFFRKYTLINGADNSSLFTSAFVNFYFGFAR